MRSSTARSRVRSTHFSTSTPISRASDGPANRCRRAKTSRQKFQVVRVENGRHVGAVQHLPRLGLRLDQHYLLVRMPPHHRLSDLLQPAAYFLRLGLQLPVLKPSGYV
jgi:hypothetical protein